MAMLAEGGLKGLFRRRNARREVEDEIARYEADPEAALAELGRSFPTLRRVVIDDRDTFMARNIRAGLAGIHVGLAVVGDGHVPGLLRHLHDLEVETYRLSDVRGGRLPKPDPGSTSTVGFRFDLGPGGGTRGPQQG